MHFVVSSVLQSFYSNSQDTAFKTDHSIPQKSVIIKIFVSVSTLLNFSSEKGVAEMCVPLAF
jgi:hypothetical protein